MLMQLQDLSYAKEGVLVARKTNEIKAVMHLPESETAIRQFEKKICNFYAAQVEKKLCSLPKKEKLEVLQNLIENFTT